MGVLRKYEYCDIQGVCWLVQEKTQNKLSGRKSEGTPKLRLMCSVQGANQLIHGYCPATGGKDDETVILRTLLL